MRSILSVFVLFLVSTAFGQISVRPIIVSSNQEQRIGQSEEEDPIELPFWDDFSKSSTRPDTLWEFSDAVTIGENLAKNPPTYKAASLDGVDAQGVPYDDQDIFPGLADQLISRRIDLSNLTNDETIYLSFFWEAGGNAETPEDTGDSLRLQMLNSDSIWVTLWKKHAVDLNTTEDFVQEIVKVESSFRHQNFRFKFETFGSQFGPFDTWYIDYVYMNNGRSTSDLTYFDRAMSGFISPLISPWREMPAEHFFANPAEFITNQGLIATNLLETPHTLILQYDLHDTDSDNTYSLTDSNNGLLAGEVKQVEFVEIPTIPAQTPSADSVVFNIEIFSNFNDPSTPIDFGVNDTLRDSYTFHNYYAYDDGRPEYAAGVAQNGSVALEYIIPTKDTLTHIDFYFPTIFPSPVGKTIYVNVWRKLDGSDPIETRTITITEDLLDSFTRVQIPRSVVVNDTIYIGYKQKSIEFIGVGLDKSNVEASSRMFFLSDNWVRNEKIKGIMMIRPVFQRLSDFPVGVLDQPIFKFFPNPVESQLTINENYSLMRILNLNGQVLLTQLRSTRHDLSTLKTGIYILEVSHNGQIRRSLLRKN